MGQVLSVIKETFLNSELTGEEYDQYRNNLDNYDQLRQINAFNNNRPNILQEESDGESVYSDTTLVDENNNNITHLDQLNNGNRVTRRM